MLYMTSNMSTKNSYILVFRQMCLLEVLNTLEIGTRESIIMWVEEARGVDSVHDPFVWWIKCHMVQFSVFFQSCYNTHDFVGRIGVLLMFIRDKWEVEFHLVIMKQNSKRKKKNFFNSWNNIKNNIKCRLLWEP